jgi:hypothetical protein
LFDSILLAAESPSVNEVISRYENYLCSLLPLSFDYEMKYIGSSGTKKGMIKHDGSSFVVRTASTNEPKYRHEFLYYKGRLLLIYKSFAPNDELTLISWLKPTQDDFEFSNRNNPIPQVFGYFSFDGIGVNIHDYIPSVLRKYPDNISIKQDAFKKQLTLTLAVNDILFEIIFDDSKNFVPLEYKLTLTQKTSQLSSNQIYSRKFIFEKYNNNFPEKCTYSFYKVNSDLSIYKSPSNEYFFKNVKIGLPLVETDFDVVEPIANYTEVFVQDDSQIQYVWLDGEIVPYTDEIAMSRLRGDKFVPGIYELRLWLIVLGLFMIVLGIGLKIKSIIYNSNKGD